LMRRAVERDRSADDGCVAAESTLPESFTEYGDVSPVRPILFGRERPAGDNRRAEQPKKVGAHLTGGDLFRIAGAGQVDDVEAVRRRVLKRAGLAPPEIELRRGGTGPRPLWRGVEKHHQPVWIRVRQRLQQDGVED